MAPHSLEKTNARFPFTHSIQCYLIQSKVRKFRLNFKVHFKNNLERILSKYTMHNPSLTQHNLDETFNLSEFCKWMKFTLLFIKTFLILITPNLTVLSYSLYNKFKDISILLQNSRARKEFRFYKKSSSITAWFNTSEILNPSKWNILLKIIQLVFSPSIFTSGEWLHEDFNFSIL